MKTIFKLAISTASFIIFTGAAVESGKELIKMITNTTK